MQKLFYEIFHYLRRYDRRSLDFEEKSCYNGGFQMELKHKSIFSTGNSEILSV